jgi:hypothetical protein
MLFEKSNGNVQGVLQLMEEFPLAKIEKIYSFWVEITLPTEEREKRMRKEADAAAEKARQQLFSATMENNNGETEIDAETKAAMERFSGLLKRNS